MTALLDVDQLRTFIAIAETGSFTRAADIVHKTQSAVSMQMKRLEERLDRAIFARDGRASKLTEDGERLLDYARRIVKLNVETHRGVLRRAHRPRAARRAGRLCRPLSARDHGALLARLSGDRADRDLRGDHLPARAHQGERDRSCDHHQLLRQHDGGEFPPGAPAVGDVEPALDPLEERLPLALGRPTCAWRRAAIECLEAIGRPYRVLYSSGNASAIGAAVLSGLAVSVFPESGLRPGMRVLSAADGFPELPSCRIGLVRNPHERNLAGGRAGRARHLVARQPVGGRAGGGVALRRFSAFATPARCRR